MNFFKRLFRWWKSEAHNALDKIEDPVKMLEQGLRDLRSDLEKSIEGLAKAKEITIKHKKHIEEARASAQDYEQKALALLTRASKGEIAAEEADRLASEALSVKADREEKSKKLAVDLSRYEIMTEKMETNVKTLKSQIKSWEDELSFLKARSQVAEASRRINKELSSVDSSQTVSVLERMKERIESKEHLAEAYGEIALSQKSTLDDAIDVALDTKAAHTRLALEDLKKRIGN